MMCLTAENWTVRDLMERREFPTDKQNGLCLVARRSMVHVCTEKQCLLTISLDLTLEKDHIEKEIS
jgi:hypothetical protein